MSTPDGILRVVLSILICLTLAPVQAQDKPPFQLTFNPWSSPGTSLTVDLVSVLEKPPNGRAEISIKQTGFTDTGSNLVLWQWNPPGYYRFKPFLGEDGSVGLAPETDVFVLDGYLAGQGFYIVLNDEALGTRAQANFVPFPIEAKGNGNCEAAAYLIRADARMWLLRVTGYEPGEKVTTKRSVKKDTVREEHIFPDGPPEDQQVDHGILELIFPISKSKGEAQFVAEGANGCTVSLAFAVGKSAFKSK